MSETLAATLDESTMGEDVTEGTPFWNYSMRLYREQGIEENCLEYQDCCNANVNLLLFCCWAGAQRRQFSADELASASELIHNWDQQVVQQLRQLRQLVKKVDIAEHVFANEEDEPDTQVFRGQIRELELIAERIVQDSLYQWWQELPDYIGVDIESAVAGNINSYLSLLGADTVEVTHPLVQAGFRVQL